MTNHYRLEGLKARRKGTMKEKTVTLKVEGAAQGKDIISGATQP